MSDERALLVAAGGGIGDTLLATVVARALRTQYAAVDALVLPAHRALAERIPDIARVIDFSGSPRTLARHLAPAHYRAAIVTWATAQTAQVPWFARIPIRVGQAHRLYSCAFTQRVVVKSERGDRLTHWTQILLDYARAIGCEATDAQPRFVPNDSDEGEASALLRVHDIAGPFAILHPTRGLSAQRSRWPLEGFIALARALEERLNLPLLVSGARGDAAIADAIAAASGQRTISVAGATTIGTFGALARRAAFVVAMDSGPMHVAAASGAPTVGIFALQSDEPDRWAPLGANAAVVRASYPCPTGHRKETCPDFACVRALAVPEIVAAVERVCARAATG